MRSFIALAFMTTPALAHPGHGAHLHGPSGLWIAAALIVATAITLAGLRKTVRARA